jgi:hypothetical protein
MTTVQLQRRGVSKDCFYGWFNPCPHGERNHIEFLRHYRGFWLVNWSLPNCHICHMAVACKLPDAGNAQLTTSRPHRTP